MQSDSSPAQEPVSLVSHRRLGEKRELGSELRHNSGTQSVWIRVWVVN